MEKKGELRVKNVFLFMNAGEPIFEVIKDVQPDTELVAWFLPASHEDLVFISRDVCSRSAIYRCSIDSILAGKFYSLKINILYFFCFSLHLHIARTNYYTHDSHLQISI